MEGDTRAYRILRFSEQRSTYRIRRTQPNSPPELSVSYARHQMPQPPLCASAYFQVALLPGSMPVARHDANYSLLELKLIRAIHNVFVPGMVSMKAVAVYKPLLLPELAFEGSSWQRCTVFCCAGYGSVI